MDVHSKKVDSSIVSVQRLQGRVFSDGGVLWNLTFLLCSWHPLTSVELTLLILFLFLRTTRAEESDNT